MGSSRRNENDHQSPSPTKLIVLIMAMMMMMPVLAESEELINELCRRSIKPKICMQVVKGARNREEALKKAVESTAQFNTDKLQKMLPVVLHSFDNLPNKMSKESATKTCQSEFTNIDYNLKDAIRYLSQNDIRSLGIYLTACRLVFCKEAFTNHDLTFPPQFSNLEDQFYSHIDTCLSLLNSNSNSGQN